MLQRLFHSGLLTVCLLSVPRLAAGQEVALRFALQAGAQAFSCASPALPLGQPAVPTRLKDAKFYLSDIRLIRDDGQLQALQLHADAWQSHDVALLDFVPGGPGVTPCKGKCLPRTTVACSSPSVYRYKV